MFALHVNSLRWTRSGDFKILGILGSHTQSMNVDEDSDQELDFKPPWIPQHWRLNEAYANMLVPNSHVLAQMF